MKKEIEFLPTKIIIHDYNLGDCNQLERTLSVWDKVYFKDIFKAYLYDDIKKNLIIPGGYDSSKVKYYFPDYNYINDKNNVDKCKEVKYRMVIPPKNDLQELAINRLLNSNNTQKFLIMRTGTGKTYCAINYVNKIKKLPILFVDQLTIAEQWLDRISYFTNVKKDEIYIISGKKKINDLYEMSKKKLNHYKWFIMIHRTAQSYMDEDIYNIDKLLKYLQIGIKLFDEAHVEYTNTFYIDATTNTDSLYISATPKKSDPSSDKVYQNMYINAYKVDLTDTDNYCYVKVIKYNSNPDVKEQFSMINKYGFDGNKWSKYIINDNKIKEFTDILLKILNIFLKKNDKHKIAILFHTINGVDLLKDIISNEYQNLIVNKFDSTIKDQEERNNILTNSDIIITTDKSFGKALDIDGLDILINTVPFSSAVITEQIMGRLRKIPDKKVYFVDMVDIGFKNCVNQIKSRLNIYNKKAKDISIVNI